MVVIPNLLTYSIKYRFVQIDCFALIVSDLYFGFVPLLYPKHLRLSFVLIHQNFPNVFCQKEFQYCLAMSRLRKKVNYNCLLLI
jgi:hypothetical protein